MRAFSAPLPRRATAPGHSAHPRRQPPQPGDGPEPGGIPVAALCVDDAGPVVKVLGFLVAIDQWCLGITVTPFKKNDKE